jgi:hypothetical protein
MAHAVVIQVKIDPDSDWEHRHSILNDFILPKARALPGLEKGIWMNDGAGTGARVSLSSIRNRTQRLRSIHSLLRGSADQRKSSMWATHSAGPTPDVHAGLARRF